MHSHTTELLPCPFCNGTPELRETGGWSGIGCNTDKCPAYLHALMFRTPAGAIAAWNRRSYATALCQQASATKDEALRVAREALAEIEWSNDSKWQSDRARSVLLTIEAASASTGADGVASHRAAQDLAARFHEAYERLAPSFGYATREDTRAFDPQSTNGRLMVAVCEELLARSALRTIALAVEAPSDAAASASGAVGETAGKAGLPKQATCTNSQTELVQDLVGALGEVLPWLEGSKSIEARELGEDVRTLIRQAQRETASTAAATGDVVAWKGERHEG